MSCLTVLSRIVNPPFAWANRKKDKKNAAENCEFWVRRAYPKHRSEGVVQAVPSSSERQAD
jgi:hypothetical protein